MKYTIRSGESEFEVEIDRHGGLRVNGRSVQVDLKQVADTPYYSLLVGNRSYELRIEKIEESYEVQIKGMGIEVAVQDERTKLLAGLKSSRIADTNEILIKSPMPGIVIDLPVSVGETVVAGQLLVVVESMKMHNEFTAPRAGRVKAIRVILGDKIPQNGIMIALL
jgi:propionyl-CoA carboxylase alpha chain